MGMYDPNNGAAMVVREDDLVLRAVLILSAICYCEYYALVSNIMF